MPSAGIAPHLVGHFEWFVVGDAAAGGGLAVGLLQRVEPQRILELGCGISTLVFATYATLRSADQVRVSSIDHDPAWLTSLSEQLQSHQLAAPVRLVHAPIVAWSDTKPALQTYSPSRIRQAVQQMGGGVDLVLIDGPPAHLFGRSGTLPTVVSSLSERGVVLLDDACRPHEYELCRQWQTQFAEQLTWRGTVPVGHGIAVFTRRGCPLPSLPTLRR